MIYFRTFFFVLMNEFFKFPALTVLQGFLKQICRLFKIAIKLKDVYTFNVQKKTTEIGTKIKG